MFKTIALASFFPAAAAASLVLIAPGMHIGSVDRNVASRCVTACRGQVESFRECLEEDETDSPDSREQCLDRLKSFDAALAAIEGDASLAGRGMLDKIAVASAAGLRESAASPGGPCSAKTADLFGTCSNISAAFLDVHCPSLLQRLIR
ncbi:MAG: hypothetical protein ACR2IT_09645 [Pirellulales bacterium]